MGVALRSGLLERHRDPQVRLRMRIGDAHGRDALRNPPTDSRQQPVEINEGLRVCAELKRRSRLDHPVRHDSRRECRRRLRRR